MALNPSIDILESALRRKGGLLETLLIDRSSNKNIIWATDSYEYLGNDFLPNKPIKPDLITGLYSKLIQPRAAKPLEEQRRRTKDKAEVFTPLKTVDMMNRSVDKSNGLHLDKSTWQDYVREIKIEITCGEAPFIVSRYNPTSHTGKLIKTSHRVGFLDKKLQTISHHCDKPKDWLMWAKEAYKASYGYEWQGDNILIARENLLYTLVDYHTEKFGRHPSLAVQQEFAEIISWNIFQMDGIKYVLPMSCHHETRVIPGELTLFGETPDLVEKDECEGCKFSRPTRHNGKYAKVMDWEANRQVKFVTLLQEA